MHAQFEITRRYSVRFSRVLSELMIIGVFSRVYVFWGIVCFR